MVKKSPKIKIIVGPTSSGKTSYAINECKKTGGEIISFDSRQLFKYMDIGTGKVPINSVVTYSNHGSYWLIDNVKIWGYDLTLPDQYFSAYDYALYAKAKIEVHLSADTPVYLVGGTGFYLDILLGNIRLDAGAPDLQLRAELAALSHLDLLAKLKQLDNKKFDSIDQNNPRRVLRAVESALTVGRHSKQVRFESPLRNLEIETLGFIAPNEVLYNRSDLWLEYIWRNGLLTETDFLLKNYPNSPGLKGLIYKQAVDVINGATSEVIAKEKAKFSIHAYIRRQLTWFKKNPDVKWVAVSKENNV